MRTLLLTQSPDTDCVISRRCRTSTRMLVWIGAWWLDRALAEGVSPDSSPTLSLRAHQLIGLGARRALARELRELIPSALRAARPFSSGITVSPGVFRSREAIEQLADRLDAHQAVEPGGVARIRLLLRDGASPLYDERIADRLEESMTEALDGLEPHW